MVCNKCGKEFEGINSLCPECEAIAIAASDVKKARFFGFGAAIGAGVCALLSVVFAVMALVYSGITGAWLGYAIFTGVLMALGFLSGGSAVVDYLERQNFKVKPLPTFITGLASMGLAVVAAIILLVSIIFVSIIMFIIVFAAILLLLTAKVVLPIIREKRYVSVSEELAARNV